MCEFDEGPVSSGAAAAFIGERALGRFTYRSRGRQREALGLGKGHARTILIDFSDPDRGVQAGFWTHNFSIGTN